MLARYRGGSLPRAENALAHEISLLADAVPARFDGYDITGALEEIWTVVRALNKHVEDERPWELAKDRARAADLDRALYTLADGLRAVAIALSPYLPETAPRILDALRQPRVLAWDQVASNRAEPVDGISASAPLFPRVETATPAA